MDQPPGLLAMPVGTCVWRRVDPPRLGSASHVLGGTRDVVWTRRASFPSEQRCRLDPLPRLPSELRQIPGGDVRCCLDTPWLPGNRVDR